MKLYNNSRVVGGDYFLLMNLKGSKYTLSYYLDQFNIDEYIIYKATNCFRRFTIEELLEEKYTCYLFIMKDIYDEENFNRWLKWIKGRISINYLVKPFPNFNPYEKIKEIEL